MFPKFFAPVGLALLVLFTGGLVQAQEFDAFNNNACTSVSVVYLPSETVGPDGFKTYKMFEVEQIDNVWSLTDSAENSAQLQRYDTTENIDGSAVLMRFKFGPGEYKKYCVDFQEALPIGSQGELGKSVGGENGLDLLSNYVRMIYKFGSLFIGLIGVLVIVISGVQITAGGLDPSGFESAKSRIIAAIFSLVLLYSSAMILRVVNPGFFT